MRFIYEATDKTGRLRRGIVEAASEDAVRILLKANALTPVSIAPYVTFEEKIREFFRSIFAPIKAKDKALFSRQLSTMISAGLPLMEALHTLHEQVPNPSLKQVIAKIIKDIERGKSFSMALAAHPLVFSRIYVSMVKSGEASGKLDRILLELADQQEKDLALTSKIRGAMIYPAFVLSAIIAVGILMMVLVIPKIAPIFKEANVELPIQTKLLISMASFFSKWWFLIILGILGIIVLFKIFISTREGKKLWHRAVLFLPIFGRMTRELAIARFARTQSLLLGAGVPILDSLALSAEVTGNLVYEAELKKMTAQVERGVPLSQPLRESENFPPLVANMVRVGEETGRVDQMLSNLAKFYEQNLDRLASNLTTLLEPFITLLLGIGVAFIAFSILVPIFKMTALF